MCPGKSAHGSAVPKERFGSPELTRTPFMDDFRLISGSQVQASSNVSDLMGATSLLDDNAASAPAGASSNKPSKAALDAVIGIGVLIK